MIPQYKLSVIFLLAVCGCSEANVEINAKPQGKFTVTCGIETSRVSLGDRTGTKYDVCWDRSDRIWINGLISEFADIDEKNPSVAGFSFNAEPALPYRTVFPASAMAKSSDATHVVLPSSQLRREGSFPLGSNILIGCGDEVRVTMANACGFLKLRLLESSAGGDRISRIKIVGNAGEQICGEFGVDYDACRLVSAGEGNAVTLECGGVQLSGYIVDFIISLPACTFERGFTVEIYNDKNRCQTKKMTKRLELKAGVMVAMDEFRFNPTHTVVDTSIGDGSAEPSDIYALNKVAELCSHVSETDLSLLELDYRSYYYLDSEFLGIPDVNYPRLKKCGEGRYLLIYQQRPQSTTVWYTTSSDMRNWAEPKQLFSPYSVINGGGERDTRAFSSTDALVLQNGDVLAFTSYRAVYGYNYYDDSNGIVMKRSTDGGLTWGEEQEIFKGSTWEPYGLQLPSGEIHVYFTHCIPLVGDSGTSLLRSSDNGHTWTSQCKIIRQLGGETRDGSDTPVYTDQMPVARLICGSDKIVVALESRFKIDGVDNNLYISMAWSDDNWSKTLTGSETGPAERQDNLFRGGGPYISQFTSGETVLTYNIGNILYSRLGNAQGANFADVSPYPVFNLIDKGFWNATEIVGSHAIAAVFRWVYPEDTEDACRLKIGKMILNHRVDAPRATVSVDGWNIDWVENTDALFMGSESQAQAAYRFAHDDDYLYVLVEKLDDEVKSSDNILLMFHSGSGVGSPLKINFTVDDTCHAVAVDRTDVVTETHFSNRGYVIEAAIPKKLLNVRDDTVRVNAEMVDAGTIDTWNGLTSRNYSKWLPIRLR